MKLSGIKQEHVLEAVAFIDHEGIPKKYLKTNYWVQVGGKEYPFNYLLRIAYQTVPGQEGQWQDVKSNDSIRAYMEQLSFEVKYRKEELGFFHESEVRLFSELAEKPYRKANKDHVRFGEHLKPLALKVNKWAELSLIEDLQYERSMKWQRYGHFKPYMWIRVRRPGSSPQVYFVIGCEGNGYLYAELNCQREDSKKAAKLPEEKIVALDAYLFKSHYAPLRIAADEIVKYDWINLVERTQDFISRHLALYDELNALVTGKQVPTAEKRQGLELTDPPSSTKSYADKRRTFKGHKIDWDKKLQGSRALGTSGEQMVIDHERAALTLAGCVDKAEVVDKVLDGRGFDILSFDEAGEEKHIEVKTTTCGLDEPFYMSENEVEYFRHEPRAVLFRVYEYDPIANSAKFYVLKADELLGTNMAPLSYEVSINAMDK